MVSLMMCTHISGVFNDVHDVGDHGGGRVLELRQRDGLQVRPAEDRRRDERRDEELQALQPADLAPPHPSFLVATQSVGRPEETVLESWTITVAW